MNWKYILIGCGIGCVIIIIVSMFFLIKEPIKNNKIIIAKLNGNNLEIPKEMPKPKLPETEIKVSSENEEEKTIESKCNSQVIKCTINGCEEVC